MLYFQKSTLIIGRDFPCLFYFEVDMTLNTQQNKISYLGNGIAKDFPIPFPFLDSSHISVWQEHNKVKMQRTDWIIRESMLMFDTAPETNAQIIIMREVPLTQETDYRDNEILSAETLERCFDKLTMQVQQLQERSNRALTVDIFDNTATADLIPSIKESASLCIRLSQEAQDAMSIAEEAVKTLSDKAPLSSPTFTGTVFGPTPESVLEEDTRLVTAEWVKNQRQTGYGLGLPDWTNPTTLVWGQEYTTQTSPQQNGWLQLSFSCANLNPVSIKINNQQKTLSNAGNGISIAGYHLLPYQACSSIYVTGSSGAITFYPSL